MIVINSLEKIKAFYKNIQLYIHLMVLITLQVPKEGYWEREGFNFKLSDKEKLN